jgi:predicted MFS family arabinose efflux permease
MSKSSNVLSWSCGQIFFILSVLVAVVFAILSDEILQKLQLSESDLGLLGGVFFVTYALSQLVLGILISRVPARLILGPTALLAAGGTFLFSVSHGLAAAVIARGLMGIGLGSTFVGVIYLVGRRYGARFAFMSAVSQSLANVCAAALAILSALLPILVDFRLPFLLLAVLFVVSAAVIFLFVDDAPEQTPGLEPSLLDALKASLSSGQFWAATVFYCGTFGTLLAFADLWNIQFQMNFFEHSVQQSAVMNSMIPLGVTVGGLVAGAWAGKAGFVLPARVLTILVVLCFVVLLLVPLPLAGARAVMFIIGCGFGSSTLGLAAIHQNLPGSAAPLATSLAVTAACIFGGIIQPLVGSAIGSPHRATELLALVRTSNPDFGTYQRGLVWLLASIVAAVIASFLFRTPAKSGE